MLGSIIVLAYGPYCITLWIFQAQRKSLWFHVVARKKPSADRADGQYET